ncbi:hypothetical protein AB0I53_09820 [Saccharopolyspora sp. NPDC050389]|uniref:hypothetical protein n=1 Tax=Saccharopolyspora sp. NPDC050389 TaxID=3155516 RepID=UPI0033E0F484
MNQEHLILSARSWWCEPDEPILWAVPDPYHIPLFEVGGLDEHGKKRRSIVTRAAFQVGALPFRVNALISWGDEPADDRSQPSAVVSARGVDTLAVRMTGTAGDAIPGALPGVLVATPQRLALLELPEYPEGSLDVLDKAMDTVMKVTGPVGRLADDFAGTMNSAINGKGRAFDHKGQTRTLEIVERACVKTDQIVNCDVVQREFRWLGYEKEHRHRPYLRINFIDGSRLDLRIPVKTDPNRVLGLVRGNGGSSW